MIDTNPEKGTSVTLHLNGLPSADALLTSTGMTPAALAASFTRHRDRIDRETYSLVTRHPDQMGMGMVLGQRRTAAYGGTVGGTVKTRRRAANKAARRARATHRQAAR